ncbi:MAG: ABC transporter substrate-binding protein [Clostridia bacterium]|nr:ABC transporter substrate-binding protein [Clostridia bacterium]
MKNISRRDFIKLGGGSILLGTAMSAGLVGCGAGNTEKTGSHAGAPTIKLGYLPITDHLTVISHAKTKFQKLNLEPVKFSSWPELAEALKAGAVEAAFALTPISLTLRQKGVPIKGVLLGHRNGSVITVKVGNEINTVSDLKGKTIAIPSKFSTHNILLRKILSEKGIDAAKDLKIIDMAPPEMVQGLASQQINGFIVAEPFGGQAELQKVGKVLMLSKDIWPNHICCVLNVREDIIAKHPEAVQELVDSLVATGRFIEGNRQEAANLSNKYLGQKPEVILHVLTNPKDRVTYDNLLPTMDDLKATQDYMLKFGIAQKPVELAAYLDDSFARKAYKL